MKLNFNPKRLCPKVLLRPLCFIFILGFCGFVTLKLWLMTKQTDQESIRESYEVRNNSFSEIESTARLLLPLNSSAINLARFLSSFLNGTELSFARIQAKVAPRLFLALSTIPHVTQVSYLGLDGLMFSYYNDGGEAHAVYSNASLPSLCYTQPVNRDTGKLYGEAVASNLWQMADVASKERRIMVAVDEGEDSMYALAWCLKNVISQNSKDTLFLLYVKPPRPVYTTMDGTGYLFSADIMARMEKYSNDVAQGVIEKAKKMCREQSSGGDVKVEARIGDGDARDVICEMVEKLGADVLVLGCHGYGWIKRAFLGSVSNHCAQHVKCPVLIVKKPKSTIGTE